MSGWKTSCRKAASKDKWKKVSFAKTELLYLIFFISGFVFPAEVVRRDGRGRDPRRGGAGFDLRAQNICLRRSQPQISLVQGILGLFCTTVVALITFGEVYQLSMLLARKNHKFIRNVAWAVVKFVSIGEILFGMFFKEF